MNQTITHPIFRVCYKCKCEGETVELNCPQCHRPMQSRQQIKILGGLQIFIGLLLTITMLVIIVKMSQQTVGGTDYYPNYRAEDSPEKMKAALSILYAVLAFGVVNIINGVWHWLTGRRNMLLFIIMFGLAFVMIIAAQILPVMFP
jgi:hypothetical protein